MVLNMKIKTHSVKFAIYFESTQNLTAFPYDSELNKQLLVGGVIFDAVFTFCELPPFWKELFTLF